MNHNYNRKLKPLARSLRTNGTKAEACLWKYVLKAGMMKGYNFKRQRPVLNYIADFFCADLKLIIELDGSTHSLEEVAEKDEKKDADLKASGYNVLRFTDKEVLEQIGGVANAIEQWIEAREPEGGVD